MAAKNDGDKSKSAKYGKGYWMEGEGSCYVDFHYMPEMSRPHAAALVAASGVKEPPRILDYGCGMGSITAALLSFGFDVTGVDISPWPIKNCLDEVKGHVRLLGPEGLKVFKDREFNLAIAKDVLEHVPMKQLQELVDELMRISDKLIYFVPISGNNGKYVIGKEEQDLTHVIRLDKQSWLDLFPYKSSICENVAQIIKNPQDAHGYACILLEN